MARHRERTGHTEPDPQGREETSETAPEVPELPKPRRKANKRLGPRWNPMNAAYGDSTAPDFPKVS
jgi:hypothetical protein